MAKLKPDHKAKTLGQVAAFFGVGLDTVKKWRGGPDPMPGEPGAWPLREITQWRYAKQSGRIESADVRAERELLEIQKLQVEVKELEREIKETKEKVVDRELANATVAEMFEQLQNRLTAAAEEIGQSIDIPNREEFATECNRKMKLICKEFDRWSGDVIDFV